jgi:hypothetical protein
VVSIPVPGPDNSLDVVISALEKQLDRAVAAVKANDDKAGLVIPAVGVLAGIVGSNVRAEVGSQLVLALLGLATAAAGVVAIVLAVGAMRPQSYSNGPVALSAVAGVGEPANLGKLHYAEALGFAVSSAEDLAVVKAFWVQWAFRVGGAGVVVLTLFAALGGFASGGTGK